MAESDSESEAGAESEPIAPTPSGAAAPASVGALTCEAWAVVWPANLAHPMPSLDECWISEGDDGETLAYYRLLLLPLLRRSIRREGRVYLSQGDALRGAACMGSVGAIVDAAPAAVANAAAAHTAPPFYRLTVVLATGRYGIAL